MKGQLLGNLVDRARTAFQIGCAIAIAGSLIAGIATTLGSNTGASKEGASGANSGHNVNVQANGNGSSSVANPQNTVNNGSSSVANPQSTYHNVNSNTAPTTIYALMPPTGEQNISQTILQRLNLNGAPCNPCP